MHVPEQLDAPEPAGELPDPAEVLATRRPMVAGGLAGAWALLVGVALVTCVVMLTWAVSPNSAGDSAAAWRAAGLTWLGAHLVPLELSGRPVSLFPLGGLLIGLLLARRAGAWAARMVPEPSRAELAALVAGSTAIYGTGAAAVAWLSSTPTVGTAPATAFLVTGLVAAAGVLWGCAGPCGLVEGVRAAVPDATWRTLAAGLAAVGGMLAAGAALVSASLVRHASDAGGALADLAAGPVGAAGVTLVGLLSLPTLAVWAMSLMVGPGFSLGETGALSAFGGEVESLPALPVLAAIPAAAPAWAPVLLAVPVALGVLAGRIRWGRDLPTVAGALVAGAGLGVVVAGLVAALVRLTSGSLGGGRLAEVGPALLPVVGAATGLVVLGFLLEAALQSARLAWDLHRAEQRAAGEHDPRETEVDGAAAGTPSVAASADDLAGDPPVGSGAAEGAGEGPEPSAGGRRWADVTGVVTGASVAVTTRVAGAGASALSVASGAGSAAVGAVGGAGSALLGVLRPASAQVVAEAPELGRRPDEVDLRDPAADVDAAPAGPGLDDDTSEIPVITTAADGPAASGARGAAEAPGEPGAEVGVVDPAPEPPGPGTA